MGDFGRQISFQNENLVNLLQFLFLQDAWSELEVSVFLKSMVFREQNKGKILQLKVDLTEKIREILTLWGVTN